LFNRAWQTGLLCSELPFRFLQLIQTSHSRTTSTLFVRLFHLALRIAAMGKDEGETQDGNNSGKHSTYYLVLLVMTS